MSEVSVGARLTVVTPTGKLEDTIIEILEPPTTLGVAIVRCERCGPTAIWNGVGYQLRREP